MILSNHLTALSEYAPVDVGAVTYARQEVLWRWWRVNTLIMKTDYVHLYNNIAIG